MPTIPTGKMELELRRLYVRWLSRLGDNTDMNAAVDRFEKQSIDLIEKMGGRTAMLGALADFPAPKRLDLSPHIGTIYSDMKQAAIQAGIQAGLNASDVARHMFRAGMDKSYNRLNRLARTETVSAYWKNAWNSIEDLPELVMVWGAESGPRTCQWCLERDGMVMDSSQLRDHPNGRCTPIPTMTSKVEYRGSVRADGTIYQDPAWTARGKEWKPLNYNDLPSVDQIGLTDSEIRSFNRFQGGGFHSMNQQLREGVDHGWDQQIFDLENVIAKASPLPEGVVWRGDDENILESMFGLSGKWRRDYLTAYDGLVGKTVTNQGFVSTSARGSLEAASGGFERAAVQTEIRLPKGAKGVTLGSRAVYEEELELILQKGYSFKVVSVEGDPYEKIKIVLELIG